MTDRARRLAEYLEKELGWQVYDDVKKCNCGETSYGNRKFFCYSCGKKLPKMKPRRETIEQLEEAIIFALKEKK